MSVYMNPTFTIKHKKFSKHQYGFVLQLSDSVISCLESALGYSCNLFQTNHIIHPLIACYKENGHVRKIYWQAL